MELNQKNVVYIGGCGGIGSATCRRLVQKKVAHLAILDLVENDELINELGALSPSSNVFFLKVDLLSKESVAKCLNEANSRMGYIDILVNGSGIFNELSAELTIGVNLLGVIHSTMTAWSLMDKSKGNRGGLIVNISSVAGLDPLPHSPIYCASKAGVVLFTRALSENVNYKETGVSLIVVCPGITRTPLLDQFKAENKSPHSEIITHVMNVVKNQSPDELAQNIVQVIELNKNGTVYLCDLGGIKETSHQKFWDVQK